MERPSDAWWSEADGAWVHGPRDDEGQLCGLVRYWDQDGALTAEREHAAGRPHGASRAYYPNGDLAQTSTFAEGRIEGIRTFLRPARAGAQPPRLLADASPSVVACECVYEGGDMIGMRYRDAEGREVDGRGRPVPERPAAVFPTASPHPNGGWLFMRRRGANGTVTLETYEWYVDGTLRHERLQDGTDRQYYPDGRLRSEGQRILLEQRRLEHGTWVYRDARGVLQRRSEFEQGREVLRTWLRDSSEAAGAAMRRRGPVHDGVEAGIWTVDGPGDHVVHDLGPVWADAALLAEPVCGEADTEAMAAIAEAHGPATALGALARIRLAGQQRRPEVLSEVLGGEPPWLDFDSDGALVPLIGYRSTLRQILGALVWGAGTEGLEALAARLLRDNARSAALDVIDAALLRADTPELHAARATYLRALGRAGEGAQAARRADPTALDETAERLLSEIRASPDDDAPRLVFADYVAESHPEHAALIVAACYRRDTAEARAALWGALPEKLSEELSWLHLERGFAVVRTLWVQAETFLSAHDVLFRLAPLCAEIELSFASDHVAALATLPALKRYEALSFVDTSLYEETEHLARSPHLAGLRRLGLRDTNLSDEHLATICASTAWPSLGSLDIGNIREGQSYGLDGLRLLTAAPFAGALEELNIDRRWLDDGVVEVLAGLPRLCSLSMEGSRLSDEGLAALAALPHRFASLTLSWGEFGSAGAEALARSPAIAELDHLDLGRNALGERGLDAIVRAPGLGRLRSLALEGSSLAPDGRAGLATAAALVASPMAASLQRLVLAGSALGPEGAAALAGRGGRSPLPQLEHLDLSRNAIGDAGGVALARSPLLAGLRFLDLGDNELGDDTALALASVPRLREDLYVALGGATLSEAAVRALSERFGARVRLKHPWER